MITEDKIICKWCGNVRYIGRSDEHGEARTLNETCGACNSKPSLDEDARNRRGNIGMAEPV